MTMLPDMTPEQIEAMRKFLRGEVASCALIHFIVEATDEQIIECINRDYNLESFKEAS